MVYFDNTTDTQRVFIPRTNIEASAYHPSSGGTEKYYAGTNIEITPENVINVTGLTEAIENTVTSMTLNYATTGEVETMISAATSEFVTSGDVQSQITSQTQNFVSSGDVQTMISGLTTTGDVETMITSATSGLASTQEVENAISGKADTTAVTESISSALTAYTPTSGFTTINGSAITEGGNIVIEGGGDASVLEKITTLPSEPIDGAYYNYNGILLKYVNGAGNWGRWEGLQSMFTYSQPQLGCATLFYGVMPSSLDGELAFGTGWIKTSSADTNVQLWAFFDLQNNQINVYNNKDKTGNVLYTITKNAGSETEINSNNNKINVSWNDNVLQIRANDSNTQLLRYCDVTASTGHYELMQDLPYNYPNTITSLAPTHPGATSVNGYLALFSKDNRVVTPGSQIVSKNLYINNSNSGNILGYVSVAGQNQSVNTMYVTTTSGATGSLCVAQGANTAPVWKTIAQALGIDFWTGSQDDYDNMASHNATTLYIIIPDNS